MIPSPLCLRIPKIDDPLGPKQDYSIPTLQSLGITTAPTTLIPGGEHAALSRLSAFLQSKIRIAQFSKPKSLPTALHFGIDTPVERTVAAVDEGETDENPWGVEIEDMGKEMIQRETAVLSPYLKFGCLSVREFWWKVEDAVAEYKGAGKTNP